MSGLGDCSGWVAENRAPGETDSWRERLEGEKSAVWSRGGKSAWVVWAEGVECCDSGVEGGEVGGWGEGEVGGERGARMRWMVLSCCSAMARRVAGFVLVGAWLMIFLIWLILGSWVPIRSDQDRGGLGVVGEGAWGGGVDSKREGSDGEDGGVVRSWIAEGFLVRVA